MEDSEKVNQLLLILGNGPRTVTELMKTLDLGNQELFAVCQAARGAGHDVYSAFHIKSGLTKVHLGTDEVEESR